MLNKKDLEQLKKELFNYNAKREELIKKSRDIVASSKQLIYAVHRDDLKTAEQKVKQIEKEKAEIEKIAQADVDLHSEGSFFMALQEYAEAVMYYQFVTKNKIPTSEELGICVDSYLGGLADLTGEVFRRAVYLAGKGDYLAVVKIRDLVEEIYGELMYFELKDELRRKFDAIKYDLRKLEDLVLELKLKNKI